jgi:hypothetical protein
MAPTRQLINISKEDVLILTQGTSSYQEIIDDLPNCSFIKISTFNISAKELTLLNILKNLDGKKKVTLISNIPSRWPDYYHEKYRSDAKKNIRNYLTKLSPTTFKGPVEIFINFHNHSKIVLTDRMAYIGSANFSSESENNFESGILIRAPYLLKQIDESFFSAIREAANPFSEGKYGLIVIEVESILDFLGSLSEKIFKSNSNTLFLLQQDERQTVPLILDANDLRQLEIITMDTDDLVSDLTAELTVDEFVKDVTEIGVIIRRLCCEASNLVTYSRYNISDEISNRFENSGSRDTGSNLDELITDIQGEINFEYENLTELTQYDLEELNSRLNDYIRQLTGLKGLLIQRDGMEKTIDNTNI